MDRLDEEGEDRLARKLESCGLEFKLNCANCGHVHVIEQGCRQKWCPVCVRAIAAKRANKYRLAVGLMQWPLFITLTVPHDDDDPLKQLRRLRRGFGKLRNHKLWKTRVKGGVAGLEINSRTGSFHPHLHAVLDCQWLAWQTRPIQRGDSKATIKAKCMAASDELGLSWARCLTIKSMDPNWTGTIYKVKRTTAGDIASEILKYSVKGSELLAFAQPIGPVIRALQSTRLVTSFGSLYGKNLAKDNAKAQSRDCEKCGENSWVADFEVERAFHDSRRSRGH